MVASGVRPRAENGPAQEPPLPDSVPITFFPLHLFELLVLSRAAKPVEVTPPNSALYF